MKICFVVFNSFPSITSAFEYSRHLVLNGVEVDLLSLALSEEEPLVEEVYGISVYRVPAFKYGRSLRYLPNLIELLNKKIETENYDLMHVFAFRGASLLRLKFRGNKTKWLLDIRSGNVLGGVRSKIGNLITCVESSFFDIVNVLDEEVGKNILGSRPFINVPLGADFKRFTPGINYELRKNLGYKNEDIVAIYSGTLMFPRNIDTLIKGFHSAQQKVENLKLLILGDGDQRPLAETLVHELNLEDKVSFLGQIPYIDIPDYISVGDIGLAYVPITPEYYYQPPLKTVEFLAAGKAVLATTTYGNMKFVRNNENGLLVKDTPGAISEGLINLGSNRILIEKFSKVARNSVRCFNWENIVREKLISSYQNVIQAE
jgi:glycosyltransferase involved in cell wall biosynthesis